MLMCYSGRFSTGKQKNVWIWDRKQVLFLCWHVCWWKIMHRKYKELPDRYVFSISRHWRWVFKTECLIKNSSARLHSAPVLLFLNTRMCPVCERPLILYVFVCIQIEIIVMVCRFSVRPPVVSTELLFFEMDSNLSFTLFNSLHLP